MGLLERTEEKNYRVGALLAQIGSQIWREPKVLEHARMVLDDVSSATRVTVRLGVLRDSTVSYIEKRPDINAVPAMFEPNALPAHATAMGKALLAFSTPGIVAAVTDAGLDRYTPFTIVTTHALRRELAVIRLSQVASTRQEFRMGTASIGVPVFGAGGRVVAALELTVTGPGHEVYAFRPVLMVAAKGLSRQLVTSQARNRLAMDGGPVPRGWPAGIERPDCPELGSRGPMPANRLA
jgi:DNA-binding IclR family transcriptional regulator